MDNIHHALEEIIKRLVHKPFCTKYDLVVSDDSKGKIL